MERLRNVIFSLLPYSKRFPESAHRSREIMLKRRVFTKVSVLASSSFLVMTKANQVRPGNSDSVPVLHDHEDPLGKVASISDTWRIGGRIRAGIQHTDGRLIPTHPVNLRKGDFVDVAVTVEVANIKTRYTRKLEVFFVPREIVRLAGAATAKVSASS